MAETSFQNSVVSEVTGRPTIGVGSVEFPGQPLENVLKNVQKIGADQVELVTRQNVFIDSLDEAHALLEQYQVKPTAVSAFTRLNQATFGDIKIVQDLINESIDCAYELGAPFTITYYGVNPAYDRDTSIKLYADKIQPCLEHAERRGIVLLLENLFDLIPNEAPDSFRDWYRASDYSRSPDACLQLIETVDSDYFQMNFDPCNFYIAGEEPFPYAYDLLKDHIRNVHLKDARRFDSRLLPSDHGPTLQRDLFGDFACVALGEGGYNVTGFLAQLQQDGYAGVLTLEAHTRTKEIMDTLVAGARFVSSLWSAF